MSLHITTSKLGSHYSKDINAISAATLAEYIRTIRNSGDECKMIINGEIINNSEFLYFFNDEIVRKAGIHLLQCDITMSVDKMKELMDENSSAIENANFLFFGIEE